MMSGLQRHPNGLQRHPTMCAWCALCSVWYFAPYTKYILGIKRQIMDSRGTPTDSSGTPTMCMVCIQPRVYLASFTVPSVKSNMSIFVDSRGDPHMLQRHPHHMYGVYLTPRDTQLRISCIRNRNSIRSVSGVRNKLKVCKYPCPKFRCSWIPVFLVTVGVIISPVSQYQVQCISSQIWFVSSVNINYSVSGIYCAFNIRYQYPVNSITAVLQLCTYKRSKVVPGQD